MMRKDPGRTNEKGKTPHQFSKLVWLIAAVVFKFKKSCLNNRSHFLLKCPQIMNGVLSSYPGKSLSIESKIIKILSLVSIVLPAVSFSSRLWS